MSSAAAAATTTSTTPAFPVFPHLLFRVDVSSPHVCWLILNRAIAYNAISQQQYEDITQALLFLDQQRSDIHVIVLTGQGTFFSSGNDLTGFTNGSSDDDAGDIQSQVEKGVQKCQRLLDTLIEIKKPIIAAVNGPAFGIAVTMLGLCDLVYASDRATFKTPFTELAQSPEGCSSLLFPQVMGKMKANEVLLLGKTLTAYEAKERNLITDVIPHEHFHSQVATISQTLAERPINSVRASKALVMNESYKALLHQTNERELKVLVERILDPECAEAIMKHFMKKAEDKKAKQKDAIQKDKAIKSKL